MHRWYFPACPVDGPIEPPVPFGHGVSTGAVPKKCSECKHLFEGSCTRNYEEVGDYLHLDHGPCGIDGPTDPVIYENEFIKSKVEVPRKCASCWFLSVRSIGGFHCTKDAEKWGDFHRSLDWGSWQPDMVYLRLPYPKVTTTALCQYAYDGNQLAFVKEYRRINPGTSIQEARDGLARWRSIIESRL